MKNIIFGGCSMTWGQSLWYEGNFPNDNHPRDGFFYEPKICKECYEYMFENRWPRQVAKHFFKEEKVNALNGGNNMSIKEFIKDSIDENTELIIFQTTQFIRYPEYTDYQIERIEDFVLDMEARGIPVRFIHWQWVDITDEEMKIFLGDKNYDEQANRLNFPVAGRSKENMDKPVPPSGKFRLPPYDGNKLTSQIVRDRTIYILNKFNFSEIVEWHYKKDGSDLNKKYTIAGKFGIPETSTAPDTHFNKEGHELIANEIIKHLEKEIQNGTIKL
jgi:hypothetical protein